MNTTPDAWRGDRRSNAEDSTKAFVYRHVVSFEDTNLVGNVYYARHIAWQGRCREMFLREHAPGIAEDLQHGLSLATIRCACDYFTEIVAFDEVEVCMRLGEIRQNRITMLFEYWRRTALNDELIARGEQQIAVMRRSGDRLEPTLIPPVLEAALRLYAPG